MAKTMSAVEMLVLLTTVVQVVLRNRHHRLVAHEQAVIHIAAPLLQ